jgi:hypothetical protein
MKKVLSKRWFRVALLLLALTLTSTLICAWDFRIWSWRDLQVYRAMSHECHPVWKELHWGRVYVGQDVEEVIARTNPRRVTRCAEWVLLDYYNGPEGLHFTVLWIIGRHGKLVSAVAASCTWDRTFFNEITTDESKALSSTWTKHSQSKQPKEDQ